MLVKIVAFRQGDFWHEPVRAGQVLDLPDDVALYLFGVGAAKAVEQEDQPAEAVEQEDQPDQPAKAVEQEDQPAKVVKGKGLKP